MSDVWAFDHTLERPEPLLREKDADVVETYCDTVVVFKTNTQAWAGVFYFVKCRRCTPETVFLINDGDDGNENGGRASATRATGDLEFAKRAAEAHGLCVHPSLFV